jgi:ATP phosphoribosyltransferase regulatory subunit
LPVEAADRRRLKNAALDALGDRGYAEIATPTFERYEDLVRESGDRVAKELFRFFDADGTLMALRPEMTTPIARLVGQHMVDSPEPVRLCYAAQVFREAPTLLGQAREFTQIGAELIGPLVTAPGAGGDDAATGPRGDAEVVALAAAVAEACGMADAVVAVGRVDLIRAALSSAGVPDADATRLLAALGAGDLVAFENGVAETARDASAARAAAELVRLDGPAEALSRARELAGADGAPMLDELETTLDLVGERLGRVPVRLHFGMVRDFGYYTGLVFDVVAPGLGTRMGGGGRYDRLMGEFGPPRAAAGFALGLERLMQAAATRGSGATRGSEGSP